MKKYFFIKNNKKLLNYIIFPLCIFFVLSLIFFIVGSFSEVKIMDFFSNGMKFNFLIYFSNFYHQLGFTEIYVALMLTLFIIFEYVWFNLYKKKGLNKNAFSWISFFTLIFIWNIIMFFKSSSHWNFNNSCYDVDNNKLNFDIQKMLFLYQYRIIIVVVFSYQFLVLISVLLYTKLVFVKKPDFYDKNYWIISVKIIIYFFVVYSLVATIKVIMGRDYYNGIEYVVKNRIDIFYQKTGVTIDLRPELIRSPDGYQHWWTFNGLIGNPKNINWHLSHLFNDSAFPSGHMAELGVVGMCFSYIIEAKNPNSLTKSKIIAIYFFFLHQLLMLISFLINGSHWLTDTTFSWMWSIICIYLCHHIFDSIFLKIQNKWEKQEKKCVKT